MCSRQKKTGEPAIDDIASLSISQPDAKFTVPQHMQNVIVRHYVMQWENSMGGLANYPENAKWRPLDGHYDIFQSTSRYAQGANVKRVKERQGDLSQAILIGMKVKKVSSTFPCQLGIKVTGAKGNYYTCNGERYAYMVEPNEKSHSLDEIVATSSPYVNSEYLRLYPGMTSENLRSNGIVSLPGESYVFVDHQHPIVSVSLSFSATNGNVRMQSWTGSTPRRPREPTLNSLHMSATFPFTYPRLSSIRSREACQSVFCAKTNGMPDNQHRPC